MTDDKFDFALVRVKFNEIRPDNLNPRHHREPERDLTLKRLIDTHGTIDMMWICKDPDGHFRLLDGHRRYDIRVEDDYLENNPTVTCVILLAKDDPDRTLTEEEVTLWRILRERGKVKLKDFDFYLKAVEHADSQKEKGRKYFQIAREDFDWSPQYLSQIKSILEDPILSDFLKRALISVHEALLLINIPAETQIALIDARDTMSAKELRETVKLVREGKETASAIESVKHPEQDERTLIIRTAPEDAQERLIDATKDMTLHDIERVVKLIINGVTVAEAVRTVELPQTEDSELQVKEEALPEEDRSASQLPDPSGKSSSETVEGGGPPDTSPSTPEIMQRAFDRTPEREAEPEEEKPDDSKSEDEPPLETEKPKTEKPKTEKPKVEEKKKEPQVCAQAGQVEEMLQKFVNIPPKIFLARFKTASHKGNFKNRVEGIHLWSGELSDLMESNLNSDSLFICEVKRKRKALMEILKRPKHDIIDSQKATFNDLMNELKAKIEQVAKRGGWDERTRRRL